MAENGNGAGKLGSLLELLDKANRLNLIPLLLAAAIAWAYWQQAAKTDAAEARTRAALERCIGAVRSEGATTREGIRREIRDSQPATQGP